MAVCKLPNVYDRMLGNLDLYRTGAQDMNTKIEQFRLIDLLEIMDTLPDYIEIRTHPTDDFRELEYISLSPIHKLTGDDILIQLSGQDYTRHNRYKTVDVRTSFESELSVHIHETHDPISRIEFGWISLSSAHIEHPEESDES